MGIEDTYFHNMSISRVQDSEDQWGGTKQEYMPVPILQLIPCAFSQPSKLSGSNVTQTDTTNIIRYNPKIFCNPTLDIQAGDRIEVRYGLKLLGEFKAGEPYLYSSHQEIPLLLEDEA